MKRYSFLALIISFLLCSCGKDEDIALQGSFQFISKYTATVTVGGIVGVADRTFEVGEIYEGTDKGAATIEIRIAEPSELNHDCPNSWCYQEFLSVPRNHLILLSKKSTL